MLSYSEVVKTLEDPSSFLAAVNELDIKGRAAHTPYPDSAQFVKCIYEGFLRFPERLENYNLSKTERRGAKRKSLPYVIDFEPVSRCNYRCTMCQVSEWQKGQRAEDMPLSELERMKALWPYVVELKLHGMGEPLLHPDFFTMLEYFRKWYIWTRTSTNGSLLFRDEIREQITKSPLGEMQISIDGATRDTYESIRVRGKFHQVTKGCFELNRALESEGRLLTRMWVVIQAANVHELADFASLALDLGFKRLTYSLSLNDWGQEKWREVNAGKQIATNPVEEQALQIREDWGNRGLEVSIWRQSEHYSTASLSRLCPWIFERTYICSDSRVTPCAIIGNPDVVDLGSATDFIETWNDDPYTAFREAHLRGHPPKECLSCYGDNPIAQQTFVELPTPRVLTRG